MLVKSYDIHCTTTSSSKSYERLVIDFKREFFEDFIALCPDINLFECFERGIHIIRLGAQSQNHIEEIFKSMMREYFAEKLGKSSYLKSLLVQLLIYITHHADKADIESGDYANTAQKTVSEITAHINRR